MLNPIMHLRAPAQSMDFTHKFDPKTKSVTLLSKLSKDGKSVYFWWALHAPSHDHPFIKQRGRDIAQKRYEGDGPCVGTDYYPHVPQEILFFNALALALEYSDECWIVDESQMSDKAGKPTMSEQDLRLMELTFEAVAEIARREEWLDKYNFSRDPKLSRAVVLSQAFGSAEDLAWMNKGLFREVQSHIFDSFLSRK